MLNAVFVLALSQGVLAPNLPTGAGPEAHRAFQIVAEQTARGNFAEAKSNLRLVPNLAITYKWDDRNLPVALRSEWNRVRTEAFRTLSNRIPNLSLKPSEQPLIHFSFEQSLAADPETGLPRGVATFFSESVNEPRLEVVIGLNRGKPTERTSAISLYNEIVFSVGRYLGLADTPFLGAFMGRSDLQMQYQSQPDPGELAAINAIQEAAKKLRIAVDRKQALSSAKPSVSFNPQTIEKGPVVQGELIELSVQVSNLGNSPLTFRVIPDCGCVTAASAPVVQPGGSVAVPLKVDTTEIVGELNRHIILFSNDAENPIQRFPIHIKTTPRYRVLSKNPSVLIVDENGLETDIFLVTPDSKPLGVTGVEVQGNLGRATFEEWKGASPVPNSSGQAEQTSGYRIRVHLDEPQVSGRSAATVLVKTDDPKFPVIRHVMFAQKGIAAMPASIFFGDLGRAEREAVFLLTRPNKSFKILKIESDSSFIEAKATDVNGGWEYKILARYSGKAPLGDLRATLTIHTDDPKQSKIRVPVMGNVK